MVESAARRCFWIISQPFSGCGLGKMEALEGILSCDVFGVGRCGKREELIPFLLFHFLYPRKLCNHVSAFVVYFISSGRKKGG